MMYAVKSKYKNPDKFIDVLRARAKRAQGWSDDGWSRLKKLRGELITAWQPDSRDRQNNTTNCRLGDFHVEDKVMIIGRVVKVVASVDASGNRKSHIEYRRLETRRIKE